MIYQAPITLSPLIIGNGRIISFTVKDKDGDAIDLTGATAEIAFKKNKSQSTYDLYVANELDTDTNSDPLHGKGQIILPSASTETLEPNNYNYELRYTLGSENTTVIYGNIALIQGVL